MSRRKHEHAEREQYRAEAEEQSTIAAFCKLRAAVDELKATAGPVRVMALVGVCVAEIYLAGVAFGLW